MRVEGINNSTASSFRGNTASFQRKFANGFAKIDGIGEGASIAFDFLGKALVVPAVIMLSSKEPKEKKEYSAFKNPVAAVLQLALEVPILFLGSAAIEKTANKGGFDTKTSSRYNEKLYKDIFTKELKDSFKNDENNIKQINETLNTIDKKGLSRKGIETFEDLIKTAPLNKKEILEKTFGEYKNAHTNLYHLKNRLCFAFAIVLTPLICYLENKFHPVIMDKIYEQEHKSEEKKHPKNKILSKISLKTFMHQTKEINSGGAV